MTSAARHEADVKAKLTNRQMGYYRTLKNAGFVYPATMITEASRAGISLSLAAALMWQESSGGHNVFGHDPTIFVGAGYVTRLKYIAYKVRRRASGNRKMQGVGPAQLTWWAIQDRADAAGGCWRVHINMRIAFVLVKGLVKQYGFHAGVRRYNGSGPAAEKYANSVTALKAKYHRLLTNG